MKVRFGAVVLEFEGTLNWYDGPDLWNREIKVAGDIEALPNGDWHFDTVEGEHMILHNVRPQPPIVITLGGMPLEIDAVTLGGKR